MQRRHQLSQDRQAFGFRRWVTDPHRRCYSHVQGVIRHGNQRRNDQHQRGESERGDRWQGWRWCAETSPSCVRRCLALAHFHFVLRIFTFSWRLECSVIHSLKSLSRAAVLATDCSPSRSSRDDAFFRAARGGIETLRDAPGTICPAASFTGQLHCKRHPERISSMSDGGVQKDSVHA